jgi:hypothetical protein
MMRLFKHPRGHGCRTIRFACAVLLLAGVSHAGLVAHWSLDGTLSDAGTQGHHGAFEGSGAPAFEPDGRFGSVLRLNGGDQRINVGPVMTFQNASWSLSFWVRSSMSGIAVPLVGKNNGDTGFGSGERVFEISGPGTWNGVGANQEPGNFVLNGHSMGGAAGQLNPGVPVELNDGAWHMLTAIWDNVSGKLISFIDGQLVSTQTGSWNNNLQPDVGNLYLGFSNHSGDGVVGYLDGDLAEVSVYDHALAASDVAELFDASSTPLNKLELMMSRLPAGKGIIIQHSAVVDNPDAPNGDLNDDFPTETVESQGQVFGLNFNLVRTDDPASGGAADPTVTSVPINDAPEVTVPGAQTVVATGAVGVPLNVDDVDGFTVLVSISTASGVNTVSVPGTSGASVSGNGSSLLTLLGSITQVNDELASLSFTAVQLEAGSDRIIVQVDDGGLNGYNNPPFNIGLGTSVVAVNISGPLGVPPLPRLYYTFDDGSGTDVQNLGLFGGSGVLLGTGGNERWVESSPGYTAGALDFDGLNLADGGDGIHTGFTGLDLGISSSTNYTTSAWINFTKAAGDNHVFGQTNATGTVLHNGVRNSRAHLGHWGNDITAATVLQTGIWYHVVWHYEDGVERIYLNGQIDGGPAVRGVLNNVTPVVIGNNGPGNWGFQGMIDEVLVFDEALTLGQIHHLASGGDPIGLPTGPLTDGQFFTAPFGAGDTWNLYQIVGGESGLPSTWYDAQLAANATVDPSGLTGQTGNLVSIGSREENFTINRMSGFRIVWLGLTDDDTVFGKTEGTFEWLSGEPVTYTRWNGGEPSNGGPAGEDVAFMLQNGLWNDSYSNIPGSGQTTNAPSYAYAIEWNIQNSGPIPGVTIPDPILPLDLAGPPGEDLAFGVLAVNGGAAIPEIITAVQRVQSGAGTITTGLASEINFVDPESPNGGIFPSDVPIIGDTGAVDAPIVHRYTARIVIPAEDDYTFGLNTDEGFALRILGQDWLSTSGLASIDTFSPDTLYNDRGIGGSRGIIHLAAGEYDLDLVVFNSGGTGGHELFAAAGSFANELDTPLWRLVGHQSVGDLPIPGIKMVNGTNWLIRTSTPGGTPLNNLADAVNELATDPGVTSASFDVVNFTDPQGAGGGGTFGNNIDFPNGTAGGDENFAVEATATLEIPMDGDYQFGFRSDDGTELEITGGVFSQILFAVNATTVITNGGSILQHNVNTGDSNSRASIHLTAGTYDIRGLFWERGGGAYYEVWGDSIQTPIPRLLRGNGAEIIADPQGIQLVSSFPAIVMGLPVADLQAETVSLSWTSQPGEVFVVEWSLDYVTWNEILPAVPSQGFTTSLLLTVDFLNPFTVFRIRKL